MPMLDEDMPRPRAQRHELGQDLSLLSVAELDERIAALKAEIERLEADRARKGASRSAADSIFKF